MISKTDKTRAMPEDTLFEHCWNRLLAAVNQRDDPWRTPALATSGADGPQVRTVVLRGAEQGRQLLEFHTDCRAEKVLQLNDRQNAAWMFYDAIAKEQLRCRGPVSLHSEDSTARRAWDQLRAASRSGYAQRINPGEPLNESDQTIGRQQDQPMDEAMAFANFMLVRCTVQHMDWLQLGATKNIRVLIRPGSQGWLGQRVAP